MPQSSIHQAFLITDFLVNGRCNQTHKSDTDIQHRKQPESKIVQLIILLNLAGQILSSEKRYEKSEESQW